MNPHDYNKHYADAPRFYFCIRFGSWKWDSSGLYRFYKLQNAKYGEPNKGKIIMYDWRRVNLFGIFGRANRRQL